MGGSRTGGAGHARWQGWADMGVGSDSSRRCPPSTTQEEEAAKQREEQERKAHEQHLLQLQQQLEAKKTADARWVP